MIHHPLRTSASGALPEVFSLRYSKVVKILTANIGLGVAEMGTWLGQIRTTFVFCRWKFVPFILLRGRTLGGFFDYTMKYSVRQIAFLTAKSNLNNLYALIEKENPDIVIVNELLLELHKQQFEEFLKEKQFETIAWGLAKHMPGATVATVVASKLSGTSFSLEVHQVPEISGGAGFVGVRLTNSPLSIIGGHFTNSRRTLSRQQIEDVARAAKIEVQSGRSVVIAGDFNETEKRIRKVEAFQELNLKTSSQEKTFPTMLPAPLRRDLDHIFVSNDLEVIRSNTIHFGSDHLALLAETA